jgi:Tol biopolymer transport system component
MVASPPVWRPRPLVFGPTRSWGTLACAPNGRWLVAQSQRSSGNPSFFSTRWALWRVRLDGSTRRLTSPPAGSADESPRFSRKGDALLFVRMRKGNGELYTFRHGRTTGPFLFLGNNVGYYGHHDWWLTAAWSRGS